MNSRQSLMLIAFLSLVSVITSSVGLFVVFNQQEQIRTLKSKVERLESLTHNGSTSTKPQADPMQKLSDASRQISDSAVQIDRVLSQLQQHEINLSKQLARVQMSPTNEPLPQN